MALRAWFARSGAQPGAPGLRALTVSREEWRRVAEDSAAAGGRLLALWASEDERAGPIVRAVFLAEKRGLVLSLPVTDPQALYPGLEDLFPAATRMQRALADLSGLRSTDSDTRPWLRHAAWPQSHRPLIDPQPPLLRPPSPISTSMNSCVSRVMAYTRFPSVPCTPASSSRGTSDSRSWARRY